MCNLTDLNIAITDVQENVFSIKHLYRCKVLSLTLTSSMKNCPLPKYYVLTVYMYIFNLNHDYLHNVHGINNPGQT